MAILERSAPSLNLMTDPDTGEDYYVDMQGNVVGPSVSPAISQPIVPTGIAALPQSSPTQSVSAQAAPVAGLQNTLRNQIVSSWGQYGDWNASDVDREIGRAHV